MIALYGGIALILSARFRARIVGVVAWIVALCGAAAIGFSRVYRGMHHPSDVIAGALLGFAALFIAYTAVRVGQRALPNDGGPCGRRPIRRSVDEVIPVRHDVGRGRRPSRQGARRRVVRVAARRSSRTASPIRSGSRFPRAPRHPSAFAAR